MPRTVTGDFEQTLVKMTGKSWRLCAICYHRSFRFYSRFSPDQSPSRISTLLLMIPQERIMTTLTTTLHQMWQTMTEVRMWHIKCRCRMTRKTFLPNKDICRCRLLVCKMVIHSEKQSSGSERIKRLVISRPYARSSQKNPFSTAGCSFESCPDSGQKPHHKAECKNRIV